MISIALDLQNMEKLRMFFATAPDRTSKELTRARNQSAVTVERAAKQEAPIDQGILRSSIRSTFQQFGVIVEPHSKYALAVHEGSKPHWPPIKQFTGRDEALDKWVRRHGMDESAVFPIALSISQKGTKPNPFMQRAAESSEEKVIGYFDAAIDRLLAF